MGLEKITNEKGVAAIRDRAEAMSLADARQLLAQLWGGVDGLRPERDSETHHAAVSVVDDAGSVFEHIYFGIHPKTNTRDTLVHFVIAHEPDLRLTYRRFSNGRYMLVL